MLSTGQHILLWVIERIKGESGSDLFKSGIPLGWSRDERRVGIAKKREKYRGFVFQLVITHSPFKIPLYSNPSI